MGQSTYDLMWTIFPTFSNNFPTEATLNMWNLENYSKCFWNFHQNGCFKENLSSIFLYERILEMTKFSYAQATYHDIFNTFCSIFFSNHALYWICESELVRQTSINRTNKFLGGPIVNKLWKLYAFPQFSEMQVN